MALYPSQGAPCFTSHPPSTAPFSFWDPQVQGPGRHAGNAKKPGHFQDQCLIVGVDDTWVYGHKHSGIPPNQAKTYRIPASVQRSTFANALLFFGLIKL